MKEFYAIPSMSLAVKARLLRKRKSRAAALLHGIKQPLMKLQANAFVKDRKFNYHSISLISSGRIKLYRSKLNLFTPQGLELATTPRAVLQGWGAKLLSLLVAVIMLMGLAPEKIFAMEVQLAPKVEKASPPTLKFIAPSQPGKLSPAHALKANDCPLKLSQCILAATDCVNIPHTFVVGSTHTNVTIDHVNNSGGGGGTHMNQGGHDNSGGGGSHMNSGHSNIPDHNNTGGHTNNSGGGFHANAAPSHNNVPGTGHANTHGNGIPHTNINHANTDHINSPHGNTVGSETPHTNVSHINVPGSTYAHQNSWSNHANSP